MLYSVIREVVAAGMIMIGVLETRFAGFFGTTGLLVDTRLTLGAATGLSFRAAAPA